MHFLGGGAHYFHDNARLLCWGCTQIPAKIEDTRFVHVNSYIQPYSRNDTLLTSNSEGTILGYDLFLGQHIFEHSRRPQCGCRHVGSRPKEFSSDRLVDFILHTLDNSIHHVTKMSPSTIRVAAFSCQFVRELHCILLHCV
jgi:hypothetical protein